MKGNRLNWVPIMLLAFIFFSVKVCSAEFIVNHEQWKKYYFQNNTVTIASTGRSGSTLLKNSVCKNTSNYRVLKTHLLPPQREYLGKIIFIFSDPNQAAESALHKSIKSSYWGRQHFKHVETSDMLWLKKIQCTENQSPQTNLLSYDALGIYEHLCEWLFYKTRPSSVRRAQVLAIKYEHLWDPETLDAIKTFLSLDQFELPIKRERGYAKDELSWVEKKARKLYNMGTASSPRYVAYDPATEIWRDSPPFQFLEIR